MFGLKYQTFDRQSSKTELLKFDITPELSARETEQREGGELKQGDGMFVIRH